MALADLMELSLSKNSKKVGLSEERIKAQIPILRQYIAFWREYPDIFVEFLCGNNPENFQLYFYQRVFLRAVMRHRYAYAIPTPCLSFLIRLKCLNLRTISHISAQSQWRLRL